MFDKFRNKIQAWWATDIPINLASHHLSWILVAIIVTNVGIFTVGYYWGKRTGAQQLCSTISRDAFADQIYNSLCMATAGIEEDEKSEEASDNSAEETENSESVAQSDSEGADINAESTLDVKPQFYARLAGFTSFKRAEAFMCRLQKRQIPVLIKERVSKTSKGRSMTWYQVVTEPYEDQDALNSVVDILKKEEKLHDVRIDQA